jgi:hypothetical protein
MINPKTLSAKKTRGAQNGTARSETQQESEISKLLIANTTLAVWLSFLAIGGGLLALYYAKIGYLPEIEWKAVLIYLFICTIVGGTIGLLLTIALFIPGVLWSEFIIFDPAFEKHLSYNLERKEPCMRSIIICLGLPFLLLLLISHLLLLVGRAFEYWGWAAVLLLATFWIMRLRFEAILLKEKKSKAHATNKPKPVKGWYLKRIRKFLRPRRKFMSRQTFKCSFWFTLSVLLSQLSMYVIYRLSGSVREPTRFMALTVLCTAGVWISNHVVAFWYHRYPRQAVVTAFVAAGLLLFTADNFSSLSVRLMNRYGIGYNKRVNMLVTDHGFAIITSLGVPDCGTSQVCNVEILSKVGDQYFLRVGDKAYVTLPAADVVAIRPLN